MINDDIIIKRERKEEWIMGTTALLLHEQVFCPLMEASGL